jgi:hypothetical protein
MEAGECLVTNEVVDCFSEDAERLFAGKNLGI